MIHPSGTPSIVVVGEDAVAALAADRIIHSLSAAIQERGVAHWATTGGSNPADIYRELRRPERRDLVDWGAVQVWWGDDRFVPRDHELSNVKALDDILLDSDAGIAIPVGNLHPFRNGETIAAGGGAAACAAALGDELARVGPPSEGGWPVFDMVFLGMGGDGHLLSVFPDSPALEASGWTMAIPAPTHIEPHVERVTMNPAIIGAGRETLMVTTGASKAAILAQVLGPDRDPRRLPAQLACHDRATWILDQPAASLLGR